MTSPSGSPPQKAALARDLGEFLIELSIALHKHAMYPSGHPSLAPAAAGVTRRAGDLLRERSTLSLGIARNQLIIEGVATDPKHPVLAELAGRLHRHHLGAVTFSRGVTAQEVADVLKTLAVEAERSAQPLGLGPPESLRAWTHVRLHSLTYEKLELLDEGPRPGEEAPEAAGRGVRSAQLWLGLARAALAGQIGVDEAPPTTPAVIAHAIDAHPSAAGYDQVIVGYLLQIAEELKVAGGAEAVDLRRRTSRLIREMQPETLRRLLEMGGDFSQRHRFVLDATHGMAVDAVLEIVRAAADTSHQSISHSLVRMLSKLAAHAERGSAGARELADTALRDQVQRLMSGWSLEDPNPGGYGEALQQMARAAPLFAPSTETEESAEDARLVQMGLELQELGPRVWQAVARFEAKGRLKELLAVLRSAPAGPTADALWMRVATPAAVRAMLEATPVDFATLDRMLARLGLEAADALLEVLADADSRQLRRALLDRLAPLGVALGPRLLARLGDGRWYVVRNLLWLLDRLPSLPEGFAPGSYATHSDARVRREALKLRLKVAAERDAALIGALRDPDEQALRLALLAAQQGIPPGALPLVIGHATNRDLAVELRVLAIRALGRSRDRAALSALLKLADGGRTLLGRAKLPSSSLALVATIGALASGWGEDSQTQAVLARAAISNDPEVRAATDPRHRRSA
jgi:hypothetical protein